ncbi:MAG TPA: aminoglycoside 6-adenylyltransferase [Thermomicrobiales bacterium]|nr:aminoglycoside 6-adenylyltransferase [Thermomicrobiales bacterium]
MDRFVRWATAQPAIEAAMVVGSRARTDHPADAWSDLDIVIFATDPEILLENDAWLHNIGDPVITFLEATAVGAWRERRVLFDGARDVDFSVVPADLLNELNAMHPGDLLHAEVGATIARGYRVLIDRNERLTPILRRITTITECEPLPPTYEQFDETINDFWYHCVWIAKKLRRGDLIVAHECLDGHQRRLIMHLIRWHPERKGTLWHGARFMEEWAPQEVTMRLATTWAEHDTESIRCALTNMMDLVAWLTKEIANAYSLEETPVAPEVAARRWVTEISMSPPPGEVHSGPRAG